MQVVILTGADSFRTLSIAHGSSLLVSDELLCGSVSVFWSCVHDHNVMISELIPLGAPDLFASGTDPAAVKCTNANTLFWHVDVGTEIPADTSSCALFSHLS